MFNVDITKKGRRIKFHKKFLEQLRQMCNLLDMLAHTLDPPKTNIEEESANAARTAVEALNVLIDLLPELQKEAVSVDYRPLFPDGSDEKAVGRVDS